MTICFILFIYFYSCYSPRFEQSGFFYNNLDIVKAGAEDLKATIVKIGPIKREVENTDVYERWLEGNTAMTKRIQRKIIQEADDIIARFSDGDATQALQVYSKLSNECMKCHLYCDLLAYELHVPQTRVPQHKHAPPIDDNLSCTNSGFR